MFNLSLSRYLILEPTTYWPGSLLLLKRVSYSCTYTIILKNRKKVLLLVMTIPKVRELNRVSSVLVHTGTHAYGKPFVTKIVFLQGVKKNYNDSF